MKIPFFSVLAAFFLGPGATETATVVADEPVAKTVEAAQTSSVVVAPVVEPVAVEALPELKSLPLPKDMRVFTKSKAGQTSIVVIRLGHLVSLEQGGQRVVGNNEVALPLSGNAPIIWETAHRKTLDTLRGDVEWEGRAGSSTAWLRAREQLVPVSRVSSSWHDCHAFDGASGSIAVWCRFDSYAAGAARVLGDKPQQGIHAVPLDAESKKFFRVDLAPGTDGADAVVLGYSEGGRGHVIRAEATMLPGESKPSFVLMESVRVQPVVFRRFRHPPHFHRDFDIGL